MLWYFQAYSKVKQLLIYIYPLFLEGTTQYLAEFSVLYNCCCSSAAKSCLILVTSCTVAHQASLSSTISWRLLKFVSIESVMLSNHLILCRCLLLLHSIFPRIRVLSSETALCRRQPKYWNFSFSNNPSNEYSGLIFFRIDLFGLLAVQGTLKSFLQDQCYPIGSYQLSILLTVVCICQSQSPNLFPLSPLGLPWQLSW